MGLLTSPNSARHQVSGTWCADLPAPGTLGHSAEGFLTPLSLLMPAFSLEWRPRLDHSAASLATRRSPTHPRTWALKTQTVAAETAVAETTAARATVALATKGRAIAQVPQIRRCA